MDFNPEEIIRSILGGMDHIDYIKPEDIPGIDLYMDQVTTFMESRLSSSRRYPDDKILTKTMINNYAKNDLLPPPEKKKYNKEHVMFLIIIYYLKNILTINDIDKLLSPLREQFFDNPTASPSLEEIYDRIFSESKSFLPQIRSDVEAYASSAKRLMSQSSDTDYLQLFSIIGMLSFDVYLKKKIIEQLIDRMPDPPSGRKPKKKKQ
ncbi:MAG: DUF1836 domain-containing protein [Lachnospiraceae bacterium]|nr:DUF1836 domain-containing protein [Lachnospiraceae bacterium]